MTVTPRKGVDASRGFGNEEGLRTMACRNMAPSHYSAWHRFPLNTRMIRRLLHRHTRAVSRGGDGIQVSHHKIEVSGQI